MVPAVLGIMGAMSAIGTIGSAVSAAENSKNQAESLKLQREAFDYLKQMSEEQKALWADQLQAFEDNFGSIEKTLSTYYNNMTADSAVASGMQELAKSFSTAKRELSEELAQRGLSGSGAAAASMTNLFSNKATAEADLRKNATANVMAAKRDWLNVGLQQKNRALAGYSSALSTGMNNQRYLANNYGTAAQAYGKSASDAISSMGGMFGKITSTAMKLNAGVGSGSALGNDEPWYIKNYGGTNG